MREDVDDADVWAAAEREAVRRGVSHLSAVTPDQALFEKTNEVLTEWLGEPHTPDTTRAAARRLLKKHGR